MMMVMVMMDGKHRNGSSEGTENCEQSKNSENIKRQMIGWKHTKMNGGGRGERKQHTFRSALTLACSVVIYPDVKASATVHVSLNKLHQEITADVWTTAAGEKARSSRQGPFVCRANSPRAARR